MRFLGTCRRVGVWLAMLLLAALAYLWLVGLPGFMAERWLATKLGPNYHAECSNLRWGLLRGIMVKEVAITSKDSNNGFRFEAEELVLSVGRIHRESGSVGQAAFQLVNGLMVREPAEGIHLPQLSGYLEKEHHVLKLRHFEGLTGADDKQGPVRGDLTFDLKERTFKGTLDTACYPMAFVGFMPSNLVSVVSSFHYESPPLATIHLSGALGNPEALVVHGRLFADRFERYGVSIDLLHANLHYEKNVLQMENITAVRSEGVFRGSVDQDFIGKQLHLAVRSYTDPLATSRAINPSFEKWIHPYMQSQPTLLDGTIDVGSLTKKKSIDIHATVEGPELGYGPVVTDYGSAQVDISGGTVQVSNIKGAWCGGELTGTVLSDKYPGTTNRYVDLDLQINDAAFADLARLFRDSADLTNYAGRVEGSVNLTGDTKAFYDTLDGEVKMHVRNANLFRTRVGKGLSGYLSKIHPALGPNAQQDLQMTLLIKDRVIQLKNLNLKGNFNTITGSGTCTLDGQLNLRVKVKFLHDGWTAKAVQLITLPATKLFEFECKGTVSEPKWGAVNAPKNLLRFFRGEPSQQEDL